MTYSIVAKCPRTGQYGVAVSTYSPRVGATVPMVVPNRGAVAFQSVVSPDFRQIAADLLATGASADGVLAELSVKDRFWQSRQVSLVDVAGHAAAFTGEKAPAHAEHRLGKGFVVAGNIVTDVCVADAFAEFVSTQASDLALAERLMRALEAGARSGGQKEGLTSASLLVHDRYSFAIVDLRVDVHDTPVIELRRVWDFYAPLVDFYIQRNIDPTGLEKWWQAKMKLSSGWTPNHLVRPIAQQ
ncbi:MAG: DUF1028 domain-containing protein [Hyphomicrobiales bacterium]|nr:DUF1028 domain-containing protein [Hyphomicrobiales bacterium]